MQQKHRMLTYDPRLRSALVLQNPSLPTHPTDTPRQPGTVSGTICLEEFKVQNGKRSQGKL
jgi:hypothetical protein